MQAVQGLQYPPQGCYSQKHKYIGGEDIKKDPIDSIDLVCVFLCVI